jgi:hypothetical protein
MLSVQTTTPTPSMHLKLTEHGKCCIQNNQLPTISSVEFKDNSNINTLFPLSTLIVVNGVVTSQFKIKIKMFLVCAQSGGACSEAVVQFEWRAAYLRSLRAKLILAPLACQKSFKPPRYLSKHAPKTWMLYANQPTPIKKSC